MEKGVFEEVSSDLEQLSRFISFGRKKNLQSVCTSLKEFDNRYASVQKELESLKLSELEVQEKIRCLKDQTRILGAKRNSSVLDHYRTHRERVQLKRKHHLISSILSATTTPSNGLETFKELFRGDFLTFVSKISSLAEEGEAILLLQSVERELEVVANFRGVYSKNIVALGGGFSSGKSAFISSFIKNKDIKLPIGIKPVTAIPTFIVPGNSSTIKGFSLDGGVIDIGIDLFEQLSHDFIKSFDFNLKKIMPFMAIETQIKDYQHLCFIDTPGYNPAVTYGFTDEDKKTAVEYLKQANSLIWMIGLDSNGTIPLKDLSFLSDLDLSAKKLFIVANKAEIRAKSDLEDIVDEITDALDDYDIAFEGISAYSSITGIEYLYRKQSLHEFLDGQNKPNEIKADILRKCKNVISMYKKAIKKDISKAKKMCSDLNSLELDLLEVGFETEDEKFSNRMHSIKKQFGTKKYETQLQKIEEIGKLMEQATVEIFKNTGTLSYRTCTLV